MLSCLPDHHQLLFDDKGNHPSDLSQVDIPMFRDTLWKSRMASLAIHHSVRLFSQLETAESSLVISQLLDNHRAHHTRYSYSPDFLMFFSRNPMKSHEIGLMFPLNLCHCGQIDNFSGIVEVNSHALALSRHLQKVRCRDAPRGPFFLGQEIAGKGASAG